MSGPHLGPNRADIPQAQGCQVSQSGVRTPEALVFSSVATQLQTFYLLAEPQPFMEHEVFLSRNMNRGQPLMGGLKVQKYSPRVRKWASCLSVDLRASLRNYSFLFGCSSENGWSCEEVRKLNETVTQYKQLAPLAPREPGRVWRFPGEVTEAQEFGDLLKVSRVRTGEAWRTGSQASGSDPHTLCL